MIDIKKRNNLISDAVMFDEWDELKGKAREYALFPPDDEATMKAYIYRIAGHITAIPDSVKEMAVRKCFKLGISPWLDIKREVCGWKSSTLQGTQKGMTS